MTAGLLAVLSEPGVVPLAEFHDWYDHEHVPARTALTGIDHARRLRATDDQTPSWLALYDVDLDVLQTPTYRELREHRSPREQDIIGRLEALQRRTYELLTDDGNPIDAPASVILTSFTVPADQEQDLADWYAEEHGPMLLAIPGWDRIRRYRLLDGEAPTLLALHELSDAGAADTDAWRQATSTAWRDRVMAGVTARERRVFATHRTY